MELVDWQEPGSWEAKHKSDAEQGFMTSKNRFVGRAEALALQRNAGVESACKSGYRRVDLFSEDLY